MLALRDGMVVGANSSWRELTGISCDAQFPEGIGLNELASQHVDPQSAAILDSTLHALSECMLDIQPFEVRFLRKEIRHTWHVTVVPLLSPNRDFLAAIWTFADVSAESPLQAEQRLTENLQVVAQLSADIDHEFNNLLTAVIGNIEIAEADTSEGPFPSADDAKSNPIRSPKQLDDRQRHHDLNEPPLSADDIPVRIALVDDEPGIRRVGQKMLELLGHTAHVYPGGQELLDAIDAGCQLDMIILDRAMPRLRGEETFRQLRLTGCLTPVVICSGAHVDLTTFGSAASGEPSGFLGKPFTLDSLRHTISRFCPAPGETLL